MVKIVCNRGVIVSKAGKLYYEFKAGQPVEVVEEHLEFFPGWGTEKCEFKKINESSVQPSANTEESKAPKRKKKKEVN